MLVRIPVHTAPDPPRIRVCLQVGHVPPSPSVKFQEGERIVGGSISGVQGEVGLQRKDGDHTDYP